MAAVARASRGVPELFSKLARLKKLSHRGNPLLQVKYSTRVKSYTFHPITRTLESDLQALWLTKTFLLESLPLEVIYPETRLPVKELMPNIQQGIIQRRVYTYDGEESTPKSSALCLMQNMLMNIWCLGNRFPGLMDCALSYRPHVFVKWKREQYSLQTSGRTGFLVSFKNPLQPFQSHVKESAQLKLEDLGYIAPVFNLGELSTRNLAFMHPFIRDPPYPHPHMLILVDQEKDFTHRELCAQSIMFGFAHLASVALKQGLQMGQDLPQPMSIKCIATNGITLSFVCFQLNTLDLEPSTGLKNFAWIEKGVPMYKENRTHKKSVKTEEDIYSFNPEAFELFGNMFAHSLSG